MRDIVERYTYESGVRSFDRYIQSVAAELILKLQTGENISTVIDNEEIREMLGPSPIRKPDLFPARVGLVPGLYVAGSGGGVLYFNSVKYEGDNENPNSPGKLLAPQLANRNLKDSSQDSLDKAFTYVKMHLKELGIEIPKGKTVSVEIASMQGNNIDGDSAGAAKVVGLTSTLTNRPVRDDIAMTGTCTLQGDVLAIGGVKQKLRGAMDTGKIKTVFMPRRNLNDLILLPERMRAKLKVMIREQDYSPDVLATLKANFEVADVEEVSGWLARDKQTEDKMAVVLVDKVQDILKHALLPAVAQASQNASASPSVTIQFSGAKKSLSLVG